MQPLYGSLVGSQGLDLRRFRVDAGFDFSECAAEYACTVTNPISTLGQLPCTVANGGRKLAYYILSQSPPGDIILVGYSMGGLVARNLMENGRSASYGGVLNSHNLAGLVTLGTPNWGYPMLGADTSALVGSLSLAL
jgi:pimeloyl-ACP methyl ester carboxylesterase